MEKENKLTIMEKENFKELLEEQTLQIWIDGLADVLQYITLTDNQGHDDECQKSCFTVAGVREFLQTLLMKKDIGLITEQKEVNL